MSVIGFILSGGQGSRLGGVNKGLYPLLGRPMIEYVYERLLSQVDRVIVSANHDIHMYENLGFDVIKDDAGFYGLGPLAGLESLCGRVHDGDIIQVVSCDDPLLPMDLVTKQKALLLGENVEVVYPSVNGRSQYALLQCKANVLNKLPALLVARKLRMRDFIDECHSVSVAFENDTEFLNINTPEDVVTVEKLLRNDKGES